MKTNSDFEQSKMLAEFLSVESADLMFVHSTDLEGNEHYDIDFRNNQPLLEGDIPCWSLAALLCVLPYPYIEQNFRGKWTCKVEQRNIIFLREASNPVDACYEMIVDLNKHNLI